MRGRGREVRGRGREVRGRGWCDCRKVRQRSQGAAGRAMLVP